LPARLSDYEPRLLDESCLTGRAAWARLKAPSAKAKSNSRASAPLKSTPISLFPRKAAAVWDQAVAADPAPVSGKAAKVAKFIGENGASFFDEIVDGTRLLRTEVEEALAELVAAGQVVSDSYSGLRMLLNRPRHRQRRPNGGRLAGAGRWALARRKAANDATSKADRSNRVEHIAVALLRRYGVVFMSMLDHEATWLPRWRDLLRVYRKLEAQGEIRGGRFVSGFSGEQFALPEAIAALRAVKRRRSDGSLVSVSGADPLNLAGILTPGPKLAALAGNRVLYRDGIPIAFLEGENSRFLEPLEPEIENLARLALYGHVQPAIHSPRLRRLARLEQVRSDPSRGRPRAA
jgi:ATP-dependent Lhr-like helicase